MGFQLEFSEEAATQLEEIERLDQVKFRKVGKCLWLLKNNPRHPGLRTHEFKSLTWERGVKVWEAYVESKTSSAWRVFWHYGPRKDVITVLAISSHP